MDELTRVEPCRSPFEGLMTAAEWSALFALALVPALAVAALLLAVLAVAS